MTETEMRWRNAEIETPLLVHVPHASVAIPQELQPDYVNADLYGELIRMTDWYCDELFDVGYPMLVCPLSRLACDVERFADDRQERMAALGMGLAYTKASTGAVLRQVSAERRQYIVDNYYKPHHRLFNSAVTTRLEHWGKCLIIDGHSFSAEALPYENDEAARPDICIGTDDYHTPRYLAEAMGRYFERCGYSVAYNTPFAGSIVPAPYYRQDKRVASLMIELNRRLYMRPDATRTAGFLQLKQNIGRALCILQAGW